MTLHVFTIDTARPNSEPERKTLAETLGTEWRVGIVYKLDHNDWPALMDRAQLEAIKPEHVVGQ